MKPQNQIKKNTLIEAGDYIQIEGKFDKVVKAVDALGIGTKTESVKVGDIVQTRDYTFVVNNESTANHMSKYNPYCLSGGYKPIGKTNEAIAANYIPKEKVRDDLFKLFSDEITWEYQCPPERDGAIIGLLHCLGAGWEEAKTISLTSATTKDLATHIALLMDRLK